MVPPIRPVKLLANCSASTGPNGSGAAHRAHERDRPGELGHERDQTRRPGPTPTPPPRASRRGRPRRTGRRSGRSRGRSPPPSATLPAVTRRSSVSFGTSQPLSAAPASRSAFSRLLGSWIARRAAGDSAAVCEHREQLGEAVGPERLASRRRALGRRRRGRRWTASRSTWSRTAPLRSARRPSRARSRRGRSSRRGSTTMFSGPIWPCASWAPCSSAEAGPHVVEHGVGDLVGVELGERRALGVEEREQRQVVPAARGGDDHVADGHAGLGRHQQHVGAVLELGGAGDRDRRAGVAVQDRSPHLAESRASAPSRPMTTTDAGAPSAVRPDEAGLAPASARRRARARSIDDTQLAERAEHRAGGRRRLGRADREVHGGRRPPSRPRPRRGSAQRADRPRSRAPTTARTWIRCTERRAGRTR